MATREQIDQEIKCKAAKEGLEVDWKELALRLLEWRSNLYPGDSPFLIERCMKKPVRPDSDES